MATAPHGWLAARNAPRWRQLPASGCGFSLSAETDAQALRQHGTDWLADAMVAAGRAYLEEQEVGLVRSAAPSAYNATPRVALTFLAASVREGGALMVGGEGGSGPAANGTTYQTGLELELLLPPPRSEAARQQVAALAKVGRAMHARCACACARRRTRPCRRFPACFAPPC